MKNFRLRAAAVAAGLFIAAGVAQAGEHALEGSGGSQKAAVGNLRLAALRAEIAKHVKQADIEANARSLRKEIFLRAEDFARVAEDVSIETAGGKVKARGVVSVDEEKLRAALADAGIPLKPQEAGQASSSGVAAATPLSASSESEPEAGQTSSSGPETAKSEETGGAEPNPGGDSDPCAQKPTASQTQSAAQGGDETAPGAEKESRRLLANGQEVLAPPPEGASDKQNEAFRSKLMVSFTDIAVLEKMLSEGADPNYLVEVSLGYSSKLKGQLKKKAPLIYAYASWKQAKLPVFRLLAEHGGYYNWESEDGRFNLASEILKKDEEFIGYWLGLNPDLKRLKQLNLWTDDDSRSSLAEQWMGRFGSKQLEHHLEIFGRLLDLGLDPNEKVGDQYLLSLAYRKAGAEYAKALISHGADPNLNTGVYTSVLGIASETDDADMLMFALAHGAKPVSADGEPLVLEYLRSIKRSRNRKVSAEFASALIEALEDVNYRTEKSSLAEEIIGEKPPVVAAWLNRKPRIRDFPNYESLRSQLLGRWLGSRYAGQDDHFELTGRLIDELGLDANGTVRSKPLLFDAMDIKEGSERYLRVLLEKGADPNARDKYEATALFEAAGKGRFEVVKLLGEFKADFGVLNKYGETVLYMLVSDKSPSAQQVSLLCSLGADARFFNEKKGRNVLMEAIKELDEGQLEVAKALVSCGADPEVADKQGRNSLVWAIAESKTSSVELLKLLVASGGKVDHQDKFGATALSYAIGKIRADAVKYLLEAGANVDLALAVKDKIRLKGEDKAVERSLREMLKLADKPELAEIKELLKDHL
ncbi:MAG: ankyrin repeat domain-containing protein [Succinivibrionaceae bacterium]|nr:ankyrin repeat domain-containing protein [Succinivibrionaceae bacterium]